MLCCVFLTLQCGQGLLVTVDYDGLLRCGGAVLPSWVILIVETLHVKLQMAITVKPEMSGRKTWTLIVAHYHQVVSCLQIYAPTFVHKVCKKTVSHWCVSSCGAAGLSCSWRQSYSLDTCEGVDRNAAPCESKVKQDVNHIKKESRWVQDRNTFEITETP